MALVQIIIMPMFFLSGALFPMRNLPAWLQVGTLLDPLTYAVDPIRRAVLGQLPGGALAAPGVTWSGWTVPTVVELAIVAATGLLALYLASREFGKIE